jgi:OmcA/MtrC family decaheme c-type cytochrome
VAGIEKPLESCAVCHGENSLAAVDAAHEVSDLGAFANFAVTRDNADLVVSFRVTVDGSAATAATFYRAYRFNGTVRTDLGPAITGDLANRFVNNGNGNYSVRIVDGYTNYGTENNRYLIILRTGTNQLEIAAVGDYPAAIPLARLASNQACIDCHGASGEVGRFAPTRAGGHYSAPMSVDACVVCHIKNPAPSYGSAAEIVHGIHNAHGFPDGEFVSRRGNVYETTYPTYMTNCSVCHKPDSIVPATGGSALAAANAMPVTGPGCFSCHGSMESWDFTVSGTTFHEAYTAATDCSTCHEPNGIAPATVAAFHNGLETERIGIIWDGEDKSVSEGKKFTWKIDNIVDNGTTLAISWSATFNGSPINPCNTTASATAPVIFPYGPNTANEGGTSMLRSYVQGDDYVLGKSTSAPGQALAVNLSTTNTVCAGNVATTTIPVDTGIPAGTRAVVALQGKWQVPVPAGFANSMHAADWPYPLMFVRVPTPTEEWIVGSSGVVAKADQRREIADTGECLKCHVGSLYQHGNTRVDNVQMCVICHNSASSEKNVRVGMGVDATESYDGKADQTYELKTMLHAIHSAGIPGQKPIVIYRNRGIYAWAPDVSLLKNWPGTGSQIVFGSNNVTQNHNFHVPTYPRVLNNCSACHVAGFDTMVDQTKGVATTVDAGAAPWDNQLDDKLQGANTAACTSCHQDAASVGHSNQNGWTPTTFPNGRQTIIDAAK